MPRYDAHGKIRVEERHLLPAEDAFCFKTKRHEPASVISQHNLHIIPPVNLPTNATLTI